MQNWQKRRQSEKYWFKQYGSFCLTFPLNKYMLLVNVRWELGVSLILLSLLERASQCWVYSSIDIFCYALENIYSQETDTNDFIWSTTEEIAILSILEENLYWTSWEAVSYLCACREFKRFPRDSLSFKLKTIPDIRCHWAIFDNVGTVAFLRGNVNWHHFQEHVLALFLLKSISTYFLLEVIWNASSGFSLCACIMRFKGRDVERLL